MSSSPKDFAKIIRTFFGPTGMNGSIFVEFSGPYGYERVKSGSNFVSFYQLWQGFIIHLNKDMFNRWQKSDTSHHTGKTCQGTFWTAILNGKLALEYFSSIF